MKLNIFYIILLFLSSCSSSRHFAPLAFEEAKTPTPPDYSNMDYWAAHPEKSDLADFVPDENLLDNQKLAEIDVFFIHPTTFLKKSENWNFSFDDTETREWTEKGPIKHQSTVFNGTCRVYAPFYRQAHIKSYFKAQSGGYQALELAYQDVKNAFEYYLNHYNNGRPFIIATHSQGTNHGVRLLKEFVDGKTLQTQLIAAYLVGMPVKMNEFQHINPCETPEQTNCFCSWMTYKNNYKPRFYKEEWLQNAVTNPIDFTLNSSQWSVLNLHAGIVMPDFSLKYIHTVRAREYEGILHIKKPKVWFRAFIRTKNWHKADYNLFWMNIRENVALKKNAFKNLQ